MNQTAKRLVRSMVHPNAVTRERGAPHPPCGIRCVACSPSRWPAQGLRRWPAHALLVVAADRLAEREVFADVQSPFSRFDLADPRVGGRPASPPPRAWSAPGTGAVRAASPARPGTRRSGWSSCPLSIGSQARRTQNGNAPINSH